LVRATDEREISYIIEMQVEELDGFDKRVQYYTSKQYSAQISKGEELTKFTKALKDCKTLVDKWIYFIKNAVNLEVIPTNVKDIGLKHA